GALSPHGERGGRIVQGRLSMILGSLPEVQLIVPTNEEADRESIRVLKKYLDDHKIEVLHFTSEHGEKAWRRYFDTLPPFNPGEKRENRRKDIPDAWILEAVLGNMDKPGRHCVLTKDNRLQKTLEDAGAEVWRDIGELDSAIEAATAVLPIRPAAPVVAAVPLDRLRSKEFQHLDRILLGLIEAWGSPPKEMLFRQLETLGIRRQVAEAEAKILELSGMLNDTGSHLIPTNRETAILASEDPLVQTLLLKVLDHGF
uniref:PIN domain-containing protein n=1 Tax=Zoogloea sp. TaxID=49181 RepID=UPI002FE05FA9